jgi:hypothetical protein
MTETVVNTLRTAEVLIVVYTAPVPVVYTSPVPNQEREVILLKTAVKSQEGNCALVMLAKVPDCAQCGSQHLYLPPKRVPL